MRLERRQVSSLFVGGRGGGHCREISRSLLLRLGSRFTLSKFDLTEFRFRITLISSSATPWSLPRLLLSPSLWYPSPTDQSLPMQSHSTESSPSPISLSSVLYCLSMLFFPDLIFFTTRYKHFLCTHEPAIPSFHSWISFHSTNKQQLSPNLREW